MKNRAWWSTSAVAVAVLALAVFVLVAGPALADSENTFDLKFTGVITAIGADSWTVAGQTLAVNEHTVIRLTTGSPAEPGMWADVMADRQADGSWLATWITVRPPEAWLKGPVMVRPDGDIGTWVIGGQSFEGTAETRINERLGPVDVGYWAEVHAVEDPPGTLVALRIRGIEMQQTVKVYGAIQAFDPTAWVLSSMTLNIGDETLIAGEPQWGLLAHAEAMLQEDDSLLALHLKPVWIQPNMIHPDVKFTGTVESLPEGGGLIGEWTVEGQTVVVTPATVINQVKGTVEIGATVNVMGWQADDHVLAVRITVVGCEGQCGEMFRFRGRVQAMPQNGPLGQWQIGGYQVQVNQRTRIEGAQHAQIGAPAEVGAVRRQNGEMVAIWLRIGPREQDLESVKPLATESMKPSAMEGPKRH